MQYFSGTRLVVLTGLFLLVFQGAGAQRLYSGFGAGAHMSTARYRDSFDVKKTTEWRPGARVYWMGKVNVEGGISFIPEVGYTFKGFKVKAPQTGVAEQEITYHYLDVTVLQEYVFRDFFFIRVGPSISGAITAYNKTISTTGLRASGKLPLNFGAWSRFEATIHLGVGANFNNGWMAELRLTDGLSNIYDGDDGPKVRNRTLGIQISKLLR
jgi:hypothetical protein